MKRRTLDVAFSIGGAVFSVLLLVLGLVLKDQADFAATYVHDQLDEQKITFTPAEKLASEEDFQATLLEKLGTQEAVDAFVAEHNLTSEQNSKCLNEYAGKQMLTGKMAECYANDYIRLHALESSIVVDTGLEIADPTDPTKTISADGRSYTYSTISPVISAAKAVLQDLKDNGGSEDEIAAAQDQVTRPPTTAGRRSVAMTIIAGFNGGDYAYQMANATIFFVVAILISILQLSLTRGRNAF